MRNLTLDFSVRYGNNTVMNSDNKHIQDHSPRFDAPDQFEQIIAISHVEAVSVYGVLDKKIHLTYDEQTETSRVSYDAQPSLPDEEQLDLGAA